MRKIITLPLVTLLAMLGLWLAGAAASGATVPSAQHACSANISTYHNPNQVQIYVVRGCTHRFRAEADFGGKWRFGSFASTGHYSTACDESSCQHHPDGTLFQGGWQKSGGSYHCVFGCARAHTTAVALPARIRGTCPINSTECLEYTGNAGVQPGWFKVRWEINNNIWYVRDVDICGNGTRNKITVKSSWLTTIDRWRTATCTTSYPTLDAAAYDIKKTANGSYTRHWVTVR